MKTMTLLAAMALTLAAAMPAQAGSINYVVTNATQYEDNTPMPATDITQTRIEYSFCVSGGFGVKLGEVVIAGNGTTVTKSGLTAGDYCSRAYTTAKGVESLASPLLVKTVPQAGPKPPTLSATVTLAMTVKYTSHGWDLVNNVGVTRLGAECDAERSYGNGFYALKDPKGDVTYFKGQRVRATIATQCS